MRNFFSGLLSILLVAGFVFGLSELWRWRFASSAIYPAYSSLRADPLGAKAFYEALERLPGVHVQRHYRPLRELPAAPGTTLFLLGLADQALMSLPNPLGKSLQAFVQRGGRLILTLTPGRQSWESQDTAVEGTEDGESLLQHWGVQMDTVRLAPGKLLETAIQWPPFSEALPTALPWRGELVFTDLHNDWRLLYGRADHPILIERSLGQGTVVLAADSYLVSNEALWRARQVALLAWLVGTHRTVIFNETHHGIQEQAGVMTLIRTYRLHGALLGLLVLAGLFVWRYATRLVPPTALATGSTTATVTGQDSASGLVSLLQRYVAPQEVLHLCLEEWHKAMPSSRPGVPTKLAQMTQVVRHYAASSRREQQLVEGYQALSRIVQTKG